MDTVEKGIFFFSVALCCSSFVLLFHWIAGLSLNGSLKLTTLILLASLALATRLAHRFPRRL